MSTANRLDKDHAKLGQLIARRYGEAAPQGKLHRIRANLPRAIRRDLSIIDAQLAMAAHPKLRRRVDPKLAQGAYRRGYAFVAAHGRADRVRSALLDGYYGTIINVFLMAFGMMAIYYFLII